MSRRVWFLAAAAAALLGVVGSAAAMTAAGKSSSASARSPYAVPFAKASANIPRTPAARAAKKTMVFGLEGGGTGFNIGEAAEGSYFAAVVAGEPLLRGNYIIDNKGNYHLDLASKVVATKKYLKIWIRKDANWWWQGHKPTPVTASDYIYTWQQFVDPANDVSFNTGYVNIAKAKASGKKVVTFYWRTTRCSNATPCGAFADYRDLFGFIYPSFALKGSANGCGGGCTFNQYWHTGVVGSDNKPISDGPFYMASYTQGQGMLLKQNPHWYGKKSGLTSIAFKIIPNTDSEIQAMRGGELDAIAPSPETALSQLARQKNLVYSAVPSFTQEHWDIEQNPCDQVPNCPASTVTAWNPLLKKLYIREAIAEGMNRQSLIKALYGSIAPGLKPLNNPEYEIGPNATGKFAYFKQYNYNPKKAIATLKKAGCSGGPSSPNNNNAKVWTCGGHQTVFRFDTTNRASRVESGEIFQQQLMAIGIRITPSYDDPGTFFGTIIGDTKFDLGEYAWIGGPDPSGFDAIYQCYNAAKNLGGANHGRYCNQKVDKLIAKADVNLNPAQRTVQYERVAKIVADQVVIIPLYASPQIFVYKKALKGARASNNPTGEGPTWNLQFWHW